MYRHLLIILPLLASIAEVVVAGGEYAGRQVCKECHLPQNTLWENSHHDLAMQEANENTVLGDFDNAEFKHFGVVSSFSVRGGVYQVRTDGPDGKLQNYSIRYTFGVYPLQQYLIEFPGGRLQALDIAWDSRPEEQGGQRWFHLHPEDPVPHTDVLHWTGPNLNWNYMCADCHSTNLKKNYDEARDSYRTSWEELDVSCEACHGPGAVHVEWAKQSANGVAPDIPDQGLTIKLDERAGISWKLDEKTGKPYRSSPHRSNKELEVCAPCHSRRSQLSDDFEPGKAFHDSYRPALLTEGLYHPDGQLLDEVYVYGSFLQSKMHDAGVICSDCHDPHTAATRLPGDQVCYQCHVYDQYVSREHHFHPLESTGASCVECHMPPSNFMVVDARHDHSFRVPRPDLSVELATPNACNNCHRAESPEWAAAQVKKWYGKTPVGYQDFARVLNEGRARKAEAKTQLQSLASGQQQVIARATALAQLSAFPAADTMNAIQLGLNHDDPLMRLAGLEALEPLGARERALLAFPLLDDETRMVRIEAARLLAAIPPGQLPAAQKEKLENAIAEYIQAQEFSAERPESQVNLGGLYADRGEYTKAEAAYRKAIRLQPQFVPGYINLAQLFNRLGREKEAESLLRSGVSQVPENSDLYHSLGLSLVRQKKLTEALLLLEKAARLDAGNVRYAYVLGVALHSTGKTDEALGVLEAAVLRFPDNVDLLYTLTTINRDMGNLEAARRYAAVLKILLPASQSIAQLWAELNQ